MRTEEVKRCLMSWDPYLYSVVPITTGDDMPARHPVEAYSKAAQLSNLVSIMAERQCVTRCGEGEQCPIDRDLSDKH